MRKRYQTTFLIASFTAGQFLFYSCHIPNDREIICKDNFKRATALAYNKSSNPAALDSSLALLNRCIQFDSIKDAVVDLKIRLLVTIGRFKEGAEFVNSLQPSDFTYAYKKKLNHDNFVALTFASNKDTISRDNTFRTMATDIENYINSKRLSLKEFQEAFTDLFALEENYAEPSLINRQIDSLQSKYPDNVKFFEFFKR